MIFTILDFLFIDLIGDDRISTNSVDTVEKINQTMLESEFEEDYDVGSFLILFVLGGRDVDEPYTDIASILTILQFFDYFEITNNK
jgi:hypothetical protein